MTSIFIALLISLTAFAEPSLEFTTSEIHGLVTFVDSISGNPRSSPELKKVFEESRFHTAESRHMINLYQGLGEALGRGVNFPEFPKNRGIGFDVMKIIYIQSAYARDLTDLENRTRGLLPLQKHVDYFEVLKHFQPSYRELIWKPSAKWLEKDRLMYQKKSREWKTAELFKKAALFYRANWPESTPFRVSFYPLPEHSRTSQAQSLDALESVGLIKGEKDIAGRFAVIFHELCHSLYQSQSTSFQKEFDQYFRSSKSSYNHIGYVYINEVLATILGNGWAFENATGKLDPSSWYNNEKIERLSRALYPLTLDYLKASKPIDQNYINLYLTTFEKEFPRALDEVDALFSSVHLITDGESLLPGKTGALLRSRFPINSLRTSAPLNVAETLRQIEDGEERTNLIILRIKDLSQLRSAGLTKARLFPNFRSLMTKKETGLYRFEEEASSTMILILEDQATLENVLPKIESLKVIEPDQWYPLKN